MVFESKYRRQALVSWENVKEENKQEFVQSLYQKRDLTHNPIIYYFTSLMIKWIETKN
jgi:hypothetical protein